MIYFDVLITRKFVRVYISIRTELIGWMSILIDQRHGVLVVNILIITLEYASSCLDVSPILDINVVFCSVLINEPGQCCQMVECQPMN